MLSAEELDNSPQTIFNLWTFSFSTFTLYNSKLYNRQSEATRFSRFFNFILYSTCPNIIFKQSYNNKQQKSIYIYIYI